LSGSMMLTLGIVLLLAPNLLQNLLATLTLLVVSIVVTLVLSYAHKLMQKRRTPSTPV
jgi:ABC-type arginine/histidine transport system permease subunit